MVPLFAALLLSSALAADVPELVDTPDGPREVRYKEVTHVDGGEQTVEGGVARPEGTIVAEPPRARFTSQIRLRDNFNDLALATVDLVR